MNPIAHYNLLCDLQLIIDIGDARLRIARLEAELDKERAHASCVSPATRAAIDSLASDATVIKSAVVRDAAKLDAYLKERYSALKSENGAHNKTNLVNFLSKELGTFKMDLTMLSVDAKGLGAHFEPRVIRKLIAVFEARCLVTLRQDPPWWDARGPNLERAHLAYKMTVEHEAWTSSDKIVAMNATVAKHYETLLAALDQNKRADLLGFSSKLVRYVARCKSLGKGGRFGDIAECDVAYCVRCTFTKTEDDGIRNVLLAVLHEVVKVKPHGVYLLETPQEAAKRSCRRRWAQ